MAAPLSQNLRRRLVQAVEQGSSARGAARMMAIANALEGMTRAEAVRLAAMQQ